MEWERDSILYSILSPTANKTLAEMRSLYMQMKSKVFEGTGNMASAFLGMKNSTDKMEKILKTELGNTPLCSIQQPR